MDEPEDREYVITLNQKIIGGVNLERCDEENTYEIGWESEEHNMWVKKLANDLSEYFNVKIDTRLPLGADLSVFMEQGIVNSDKVLMILTREYKSRADQRLNGVGYETNVITDNLYTAATPKFIPIIKEATKNDVYPIYLGNKKGLDMTNDEEYNVNLAELIKNIRFF